MTESKNVSSPEPTPSPPGQVITPGGNQTASPSPVTTTNATAPVETPKPPVISPNLPAAMPPPGTIQSVPTTLPVESSPTTQTGSTNETTTDEAGEIVSWQASEFIAHEKTAGWYLLLMLAAIVVAGIVYGLTRDKISSAVVVIVAIVLGIVGARKPKQIEYQLDQSGVNIGQKHLLYDQFHSFSVIPEGAFSSVVLRPQKRFAPLTAIYYAPDDEPKIVKLLTKHLPLEEGKLDPFDRFMHHIRF